jgi:dolichol-phosphate mannosyltransferase
LNLSPEIVPDPAESRFSIIPIPQDSTCETLRGDPRQAKQNDWQEQDVFLLLGVLQTILAARVFFRMAKTSGGRPVEAVDQPSSARITILLPVLNEATRIANCLEGLVAQPDEVAEILVIDGGSTDTTRAIVEIYHSRDHRVRWIDASPAESRWVGKAWNLNFGLARSNPASQWVLCIDADVRVSPKLSRSMLSHAACTGVSTFSVATNQHLSGPSEALIHPSLLTTLVYRFGQPGHPCRNRHQVQGNGQCFLVAGKLYAARKPLPPPDHRCVRISRSCVDWSNGAKP